MSRAAESPVEAMHRFYYYLDERRYEDMAAMMASDGVWFRQGTELRGPAEVLQALRLRAADSSVRHVMANGFADLDTQGEASVQIYQTVYKGHAAQGEVPVAPGPDSMSAVSARLRSGEGGRWQIVSLRSSRKFNFAG
jgi:hypothetical protein